MEKDSKKLEEQIKKLDATIKEESGKIAAGDMKEGDRTIRKEMVFTKAINSSRVSLS